MNIIQNIPLLLFSLIKKLHKPPIYYFFKNNFYLYYIQNRMRNELQNLSPILVYQMGKVGSTSVVRLLEKTIKNQPIYHIHYLNPETITKIWEQKQIKIYEPWHYGKLANLITSKYLIDNFDRLIGLKNIKIITLVRDPVARNISNFFQKIEREFPEFSKMLDSGYIKLENLIQSFWNQKYVNEKYFDYWFNSEYKEILSVDISSIKFPKDKGYAIFKESQRNIDFLLLKLEKLDECLEIAMSEFLGVTVTINKQGRKNNAKNKYYHNIYSQFKDAIIFPNEYLEEIYAQKSVKSFYTEEEIEQFKRKWSR